MTSLELLFSLTVAEAISQLKQPEDEKLRHVHEFDSGCSQQAFCKAVGSLGPLKPYNGQEVAGIGGI